MFMSNHLIGFGAVTDTSTTYRYLRLRSTANVGGLTEMTLFSVQYSNDAGTTWYPTSNMTGNSAPSPLVASADSEFSASFLAYQAFDGNSGTRWASSSTAHPHYIQLDLGSGNGIAPNRMRYELFNSGGDYTLKDFTILGSNTGSFAGEEVTLLTVTSAASGGASGTVVTYTI